jgi:MoaA/NifB/PqqE/SkfB family radical SAM enzyme
MYNIIETTWIHVELTTKCQAACPFCSRNDYGFKNRTDFPLAELSIDDWRKLFDNEEFTNLKRFDFTGNFGDPMIARDIVEILDYCFTRWPTIEISISTNGGMRKPLWWSQLAEKFQHKNIVVLFSIDGLEDTNHIYRINVPYEKVIDNARAFINAGGRAVWRMVPFYHNEKQIAEAESRAVKYGFAKFDLNDQNRDYGYAFTSESTGYWIYPTSNKSVDPNTRIYPPKSFKPKDDHEIQYHNYVSHVENEWISNNRNIYCVTKEEKTFYICANGEVYPCCFMGHYPKTYKSVGTIDFSEKFGNINNNALDVGIAQALACFDNVEEKWKAKTIKEGFPTACAGCTKFSCDNFSSITPSRDNIRLNKRAIAKLKKGL